MSFFSIFIWSEVLSLHWMRDDVDPGHNVVEVLVVLIAYFLKCLHLQIQEYYIITFWWARWCRSWGSFNWMKHRGDAGSEGSCQLCWSGWNVIIITMKSSSRHHHHHHHYQLHCCKILTSKPSRKRWSFEKRLNALAVWNEKISAFWYELFRDCYDKLTSK